MVTVPWQRPHQGWEYCTKPGGGGGWGFERRLAGHTQKVGSTLSASGNAFRCYSTASQALPMFSATAAIRGVRREMGAIYRFPSLGGRVGDGWVGWPRPSWSGSEEGHGSTAVINKVLPSCPPAQKRMDTCLPSAQSWDKEHNTKWVSKGVFLTERENRNVISRRFANFSSRSASNHCICSVIHAGEPKAPAETGPDGTTQAAPSLVSILTKEALDAGPLPRTVLPHWSSPLGLRACAMPSLWGSGW